MSIPLDRLYHFIENIVKEIHSDPIVIYRFYPHGSKNIADLTTLNYTSWVDQIQYPKLLCFDQEPTDIEFYKDEPPPDFILYDNMNLGTLSDIKKWNGFGKNIFLHSEKRFSTSDERLIPVYYWSHGVIAQDWFRYARYENFQKDVRKTFLIYNRSWSGSREYRVKFADLLIENDLLSECLTTFNSVDPELGVHYNSYKFKNPQWQPKNLIENFLQPTEADASSSADFVTHDYNSTHIEVVLETLFEYPQLHLTEKSLRPIACQQPFILVADQGSLEYLQNYGFKTFDTVWSEEYDKIADPALRLETIVNLMKEISQWDTATKNSKFAQAQEIAKYNQKRFLSQEFSDLLINELKDNLTVGLKTLKDHCDNFDWHALLEWFDRMLAEPEILFDTEERKIQMLQRRDGLLAMREIMQQNVNRRS